MDFQVHNPFLRRLTVGNYDVSTSLANKRMERKGDRTPSKRGILVSKLFLGRIRPF